MLSVIASNFMSEAIKSLNVPPLLILGTSRHQFLKGCPHKSLGKTNPTRTDQKTMSIKKEDSSHVICLSAWPFRGLLSHIYQPQLDPLLLTSKPQDIKHEHIVRLTLQQPTPQGSWPSHPVTKPLSHPYRENSHQPFHLWEMVNLSSDIKCSRLGPPEELLNTRWVSGHCW